eukprot:618874-Pleurochrysis_carterae.AAC.3
MVRGECSRVSGHCGCSFDSQHLQQPLCTAAPASVSPPPLSRAPQIVAAGAEALLYGGRRLRGLEQQEL